MRRRARRSRLLPATVLALGLAACAFVLVPPGPGTAGVSAPAPAPAAPAGAALSPGLLAVTHEPAPLQSVQAPAIIGQARVVDGDTLDVNGVRIRLFGIDSPELAQSCTLPDQRAWAVGQAAKQALQARLVNATVSCVPQARDPYGRTVAVCSVGGADLNAWLVRQGWARAFRRYSEAYVYDELAAGNGTLGLWACRDLQAPWDHRRARR